MRSAWGLSFSFLDSARSEAVRAALFLDFSSQKGSIGDDCAVTTATRIYIYLIAVGAMTHGKHHCEGVRSRNFIYLFVGIVACRQAWHGEGSNTTFCFILCAGRETSKEAKTEA